MLPLPTPTCRLVATALLSATASMLYAAPVPDAAITEFVADNTELEDADGDTPDWIEIWNSSGQAGDLDGYYLTDDPLIPTKWRLPAAGFNADGYALVFASGKDRADPAAELHCNFKIGSSAGGYLALMKPDGVTVASEFASYPEQYEDVGYGSGFGAPQPVTLLAAGASARWHVPTGEVAGWKDIGFNDSAWSSGATGIGFDNSGGDYLPLIGAGDDVRTAMHTVNPSIFVRVPFTVADPTGLSALTLRMKWEDGFVAYLNGAEIHRERAPAGEPAWNATSSPTSGRSPESLVFNFDESPVAEALEPGANVLAIHGLNSQTNSSDFVVVPELAARQQDLTNPQQGYFVVPTPAAPNGARADGLVADTSFSHDRGFYDTSFNLVISSTTPDAEIRYTTDGTPPTERVGQLYTAPVPITGTTVVRALAYKPGFSSTNIDTHTYIFPEDVYGPGMVDALKSVPTISLVRQANYDLQLASVGSVAELPTGQERSQVIVASVGGDVHVQIIDVHIRRNRETNTIERQIVVNKPEAQLLAGQDLLDLKALVQQAPLPDVSNLSTEAVREIIDKAIAVADYTPSLPFSDGLNDYIEHKGSIEMIYPDGTRGFQEEGGITNFGGGFTNFAKKSFRVYFRGEYGAAKLRHPIFDGFDYPNYPPVDEFDAINLRSGSHDMFNRGGYMGPRFADDSMLEMGQIAPHGRFVHVYIDGDYWGQYHLRERWNADMASSYFGGSKDDYEAISANNSGMAFQTGTAYDGSGAFWTETRNLVAGAAPFTNAADNIDIANVIDFMLLWTSGECESEFRAFGSDTQGVPFKFMMRDPDGFMPGGGWSHDHAVTHAGPINALSEMRSEGDPDFAMLVADRIHKHFFNDGALTADKSVERLRTRFEEARPGFPAESMRWNYRTVSSWESYVNTWLNTGLPQRSVSMVDRLKAAGMYPDVIAPVYSQHGGSIAAGAGVTMSTNATAIYYTTDGSDPRFPGGALDPGATLATFSGNVPTPQDFIVSGNVWKYLDDGSDQGTAWRAPAFDDSSWAAGPSELGYTENDEATLVGSIDTDPAAPGNQRNATTYFRTTVELTNPGAYSFFLVRLLYDDGAAVYANGVEVVRTPNLPAGAAFDTFATSATPDEKAFFDFQVPASAFVDGTNTIAVEIHNERPNSSDISFDLVLRGEVDTSTGNNITEPVVLNSPALLRSRAYNSSTGEWSALNEAFFSIGSVPADATNLVLAELHYHPAEPTTAAELAVSSDRDDYEFAEFLNTGLAPIDLSGVQLTDGVSWSFADNTLVAPGERIVVARDLAAFTARYGNLPGVQIVGEYSGRFSNGGESVAVASTATGDISAVTYADALPWPTLPDGGGPSMVYVGGDPALPSSWSPHAMNGGNPGGPDSVVTGGYAAWKNTNNITNDTGDSDDDGIANIAEYAFGTDPRDGASKVGPSASITTAGGAEYLALTFQRADAATDIAITPQVSTDLETWTDDATMVTVSETANPDGLTTGLVLRTAAPVTPGGDIFVRLRVTLQP